MGSFNFSKKFLGRLPRSDRGASLVEHCVLVAAILGLGVVASTFWKDSLNHMNGSLARALDMSEPSVQLVMRRPDRGGGTEHTIVKFLNVPCLMEFDDISYNCSCPDGAKLLEWNESCTLAQQTELSGDELPPILTAPESK